MLPPMTSGGQGGDDPPPGGAGPSRPAGDARPELASDLELGVEGTRGSGTRPEGQTRRDPLEKRPGDSSPTGDPIVGRVLLDRYRATRRIGSGGMGSVYVAEQLAVGREVALKVLRSELLSNEHVRQRFRREAEVIGRLSHPNTIQIIDYGESPDGLAIMVMELLRGAALNDRLKEEGPMDVAEALDLGIGVAASLGEAHGRGLVHRDLKPANIFLVRVGERVHPKVLDFGIARLLDEEATRLTATGQVFGTPRYMSPEQALSTASVDARSDLYSLGLILFECLVGQPPFVAQTSLQYLSAHSQQTPPKLRERFPAAPAALEALIDACLEKDPADRPPTAAEVEARLVALRRGLESGAVTSRDPADTVTGVAEAGQDTGFDAPRGVEVSHSSRGAWLLAVGLLAALVAGGAWAVAGLGWGGVVQLDGGTARRADAGAALALALAGPGPDPGVPGPDLAPDGGTSADAEGIAEGAQDEGTRPEGEAGSETDPAPVGDETEAPPAGEVTPPALESTDGGGAAPSPREEPRAPRRPKEKPPSTTPPVGVGAVSGPRGLVLDTSEIDGPDLPALAEGCEKNVWRGRARLDVEGCPAGCAVLVDELCAGRTPATGRALSPGRRDVAVVCEGRVLRAAALSFESGSTTLFSCR